MSTEKSWEVHVREARALEQAAGVSPVDRLRGEFARRAESAHGRALRAAEKLAADAQRLAKRLWSEGIGANLLGERVFR